jgi:hypothetical protein
MYINKLVFNILVFIFLLVFEQDSTSPMDKVLELHVLGASQGTRC